MTNTTTDTLEAIRVLMCDAYPTESSETGGWEAMDREGPAAKPVVRVENLDEAFQIYVYASGTYAVTYDLHLSESTPQAVVVATVQACLDEEFGKA